MRTSIIGVAVISEELADSGVWNIKVRGQVEIKTVG